MSSNLHTFDSLMRPASIVLLIAGVAVGGFSLWQANSVPTLSAAGAGERQPMEWPEVEVIQPESLSVFVYEGPVATSAKSESDGLARYRFAGTFFGFGEDGRGTAVIDDLKVGREFLVNEGDQVGDLVVNRIFRDRLLVSIGNDRYTLTRGLLEQSDSPAAVNVEGSSTNSVARRAGEKLDLGKRVAENRWVFSRSKMMNYYNDVMEDPERLLSVFDSMKPVWTDNNKIDGYVLDVEGEKPFFDAVGLVEGDVVKSVNGLNMTARSRAEYLITQFADNRLNIIMMDVIRGGEKVQLRYKFIED